MQVSARDTDLCSCHSVLRTKEATVVTQTREEIEVEVPYFKDEAVDIVLNYQYGTEIRQVSTSGTPLISIEEPAEVILG